MTSYLITDLGTIQGWGPRPNGIGASGVVAGKVYNSPCRYNGGILTHLSTPPSIVNGTAWRVNNADPEYIAGWVSGPYDRATVWINDVYVDLHPYIGAPYTQAFDVNDSGIATGEAEGKGFRIDTASKQVELLELPSPYSIFPFAIANSGHVAGLAGKPDAAEAQLFFADDMVHLVSAPTSLRFDYYISMNDADVIAATYGAPGNQDHAFVYDAQTKVFTDIHGAAFYYSSARCINNHGVVVGWCADVTGSYAMIWTAADGMRRLIDLVDVQSGWTFTEANAINDKGQIVGMGTHYGKSRGFVLTPQPKDHPSHRKHPVTRELVTMIKEIIFSGGGMGILLPSGDIIYPKDGPVDPDSPLQRQDAARSDAAIGLAIQVLAQRITDRTTRTTAEDAALDIIRSAAASTHSPRSDTGRSNWLSRLVRDIAEELER